MFKKFTEVCIVAAGRSPITSYKGALYGLDPTTIASETLSATLSAYRINPSTIGEFYLGNIFTANLGQNPAKQVLNKSKLPDSIVSHTVYKVCSSGMLAVILGSMAISQGFEDVVIAGGVEIMSNAPYMYPRLLKMEGERSDSLIDDGLTDMFHHIHMGEVGEKCADKYGITREHMDIYAIKSYEKALEAWKNGKFAREVFPVTGKQGPVQIDSIKTGINFEKLKPSFRENGKITPGNAPPISDGAAMLVLASRAKAEEMNWEVLATLESFAHAEQDSLEFPTSPSLAVKKALERANKKVENVDFFEINEAFAAVGIINQQILGFDEKKLNPYGGALAIGHPVGCSGARIIVTLVNALIQEKKHIGVAGICNGGGGASAVLLHR